MPRGVSPLPQDALAAGPGLSLVLSAPVCLD
jgi:hypothetical protein